MSAVVRRCVAATLLGFVPLALLVVLTTLVLAGGKHSSNFATFWEAGRAVMHGRSPYPDVTRLPAYADPATFSPFVYPPSTAMTIAPLSLLPFAVARVLFLLVGLAAIALALRLLGVVDWRCYGAAYASAPAFASAGLGTLSPLLLLAVALAWRYRDRALVAGLAVAYAMTAKLFLWPLWLWLLRTRRFAAAGVAAAVGLAAVAASWAAIGFAGLGEYPRLLNRMTDLVGPHGYSPYALGRALGLGDAGAQHAVYALTAGALAVAARRLHDDRRLAAAALAIALLATPIVWPHYLLVLFVPIALARRAFSPLWLAPLALWLDPSAWSHGSAVRILGVLAVAGGTALACLRLLGGAGRRAELGLELSPGVLGGLEG